MKCENCGRIYNSTEGVNDSIHEFCSKSCRDGYYLVNRLPDNLQTMKSGPDQIAHPSRYNQGGIEFWDVEKAFFGIDSHIDHLVQSALEYGVRFRRKNGAEDLRKGANLLNTAADLMDGNRK